MTDYSNHNNNDDVCTNFDILQLGYHKLTMPIRQQMDDFENNDNNVFLLR